MTTAKRPRLLSIPISRALARGKSILLLGARQTGKTTLAKSLKADLSINLMQAHHRQRYETDPTRLAKEVEALSERLGGLPLIVLDEVQRVSGILDTVQHLIDDHKGQFVLTGSSARKLRRQPQANLLPGRVVSLQMDPFTLLEDPDTPLKQRLLDGSLPAIVTTPDACDRDVDLRSYTTTFLEQEVRAEAMVRNLGPFGRFLELAGAQSGHLINFSKLAGRIGVAHTTVASYYDVLHDCMMTERFVPIFHSRTRLKLTRSNKVVLFDLGVRRTCANEGRRVPAEHWGHLFEQWVGLELARLIRAQSLPLDIRFWRDPDGPEVDYVVAGGGRLVPLEVKWTDAPREPDARHIRSFQAEYAESSTEGYIICQAPRPMRLCPGVTALPWMALPEVLAAAQ